MKTSPSPWRQTLKRLLSDKRASCSLAILLFLITAVFIGPSFLPDYDYQELEKQLEAVRGLKGFSVPYAPHGEKAIWKSDIEAALKESSGE